MFQLIKRFYIIYLALFLSINSYAQRKDIDSMIQLVKIKKHDSAKINLYNKIALKYRSVDFNMAFKYSDSAIILSKKNKYQEGEAFANKNKGILYCIQGQTDSAYNCFNQSLSLYKDLENKDEQARAYMNIGIVFKNKNEYEKALEYYSKSAQVFDELKNNEGLARVYTNMSIVFHQLANFNRSLEYSFKALRLQEIEGNKNQIAKLNSDIGITYRAQKEYDEALKHFDIALKIYSEQENNLGLAEIYNNIGTIKYDNKNYSKALEFYEKALNIYNKLNRRADIARMYFNLGDANNKQKKYKRAYEYFNKSLNIRIDIDDKLGIASCYNGLGEYYLHIQNYEQSIEFLNKALEIGDQVKSFEILKEAAAWLHLAYKNTNQFKKAYKVHVNYKNYYDSLFKAENEKELTRISLMYEFDKKQQEEQIKHQAELRQRNIILYSFSGGFLLLILFAINLYRNYRLKIKTNKELTQKNHEIEKQKAETEKQRDEVTKKKQEIDDSIKYASRIQNALLPDRKILVGFIPEYFILFKPRDIVSGDFYWMAQKNNKLIIVAADCTGHGVPGAFMSMLGVAFLNEIINKKDNVKPNDILNTLRENVIDALSQKEHDSETKDGMDIAISVFDTKERYIEYAGAYNSLYIIRNKNKNKLNQDNNYLTIENSEYVLIEIKADRMPIGVYAGKSKKFTNHKIYLKKEDRLYMFSDGYTSQFGGVDNRKYRTRPFKKYLLSIQEHDMMTQKKLLNNNLEKWRGNNAQLDDILVIGLRI